MLKYQVETTFFAQCLHSLPLSHKPRGVSCVQPGNGRQALCCSWLSSVFCLCWTHGDTPLVRSKVLKATYFHLKTEKAVLSYQHTHWGRLPCWQSSCLSLCFSFGTVDPMAPTQISGASINTNVLTFCYRASYIASLATTTPSSQPYWALSEPRGHRDLLTQPNLQDQCLNLSCSYNKSIYFL